MNFLEISIVGEQEPTKIVKDCLTVASCPMTPVSLLREMRALRTKYCDQITSREASMNVLRSQLAALEQETAKYEHYVKRCDEIGKIVLLEQREKLGALTPAGMFKQDVDGSPVTLICSETSTVVWDEGAVEALPEHLVKVTVEPKKKLIGPLLAAGIEVDGFRLKTEKRVRVTW